jgi:alcohol dehydrogenase class IV
MVSFELATAGRILFGRGRVADVPAQVAALGVTRVLLVTGASPERSAGLRSGLVERGIAVFPYGFLGEPTLAVARAGVERAFAGDCDGVVAMGGGSPLDAGKAIAALLANGGDPLDYIEVIGRGRPIERPSVPMVAIPTTAGTGSEVTRNAVLAAPDERVKASLRSPHMLPRLAVVDPDLLAGAPPAVLASGGLDALSQLIEPYLSVRANPFTDALAAEGIPRSARSLRRACQDGAADPAVRSDLAVASLFGGLCLANAGLGAVHGFAAPAGGMFAAPHGAVCAALLAASMEVNLHAMRTREPQHPSLARMSDVAVWMSGREEPEAAIEWVRELCRDLAVPGLAAYGMRAADLPDLVARARSASSMRGNPIPLTDDELFAIAERSLGAAP